VGRISFDPVVTFPSGGEVRLLCARRS
jgi:hypothetical protein